MSHFDWPIAPKKLKFLEAPEKNSKFLLEDRMPSLWPTYIGQKEANFE